MYRKRIRTAAVATLDLTLEDYFAAAGATGLRSAQLQEPDVEWAVEWSLEFGKKMAAAARRRRKAITGRQTSHG